MGNQSPQKLAPPFVRAQHSAINCQSTTPESRRRSLHHDRHLRYSGSFATPLKRHLQFAGSAFGFQLYHVQGPRLPFLVRAS